MLIHTDHCDASGRACADPDLAAVLFAQPPRYAVDAAVDELGDAAPWCQIVDHAAALDESSENLTVPDGISACGR